MTLLIELCEFISVRKKYWMIPVLLVMMFLGALLFLQGTAVAPFIYTLF
jgi:hypothetical protein